MSLLKYLAKRSVAFLPPDKIELAKTPQRELDLITAEELQRLFECPIKGSGGRKPRLLANRRRGKFCGGIVFFLASEPVGQRVSLRRPA